VFRFKEFYDFLKIYRWELFPLALIIFILYFTYPLARSITETYFLEVYGAKAFPMGWLASIVAMTITIAVTNQLQKWFSVQAVFAGITILTAGFLAAGAIAYEAGGALIAGPLFVVKELYLVVLIHLFYAYCNNRIARKDIAFFYGPFAAIGAVGGILGGTIGKEWIAKSGNTWALIYTSALLVIPAISFLFSKRETHLQPSQSRAMTPIQSIKGRERWVFWLCVGTAMSQFLISVFDYQFRGTFAASIQDSKERSIYLTEVYTWINVGTLFCQWFVVPWLFQKVSNFWIQMFFPVSLVVVELSFPFLSTQVGWVAWAFIVIKSLDYSIFFNSKEFLYTLLEPLQKYGAKYFCDMWTYRSAKAVVALMLLSPMDAISLMVLAMIFGVIWIFSIARLFSRSNLGPNLAFNPTKT
jgi:ATP:ADP antiporter, AAA family